MATRTHEHHHADSATALQTRRVARVVQALSTIEGGGFPVRRPFPIAGFSHFDPFLLIDHLGPVSWQPGAALGAPDHPHRGFETVTYVLAGENEHRDSFGNADVLRPGDVQWMTAGGGVIHSEMPTARFHREGGVQEGFQIWVNLPAADKMMTPRYQTLRADEIPRATQRGRARRSARDRRRIARPRRRASTRACRSRCCTSRSQPGGALTQSVPAEQNGLMYVFKGAARIGSERREVREGQAALLESGDAVDDRGRRGRERSRRSCCCSRASR